MIDILSIESLAGALIAISIVSYYVITERKKEKKRKNADPEDLSVHELREERRRVALKLSQKDERMRYGGQVESSELRRLSQRKTEVENELNSRQE
jgi:hypothetical protein